MRLGKITLVLAAGLAAAFVATASAPDDAPDLAGGKRLFDGQCARCHGRDGSGGAGPTLQRPRLRHAPDDGALRKLVREGIPGTSMPGTWQFTDAEVAQVAAYVRSLGQIPPASIPGDPFRGRAVFEDAGGCTVCHAIAGRGASAGPDLSEIGAARGPEHLRQSILDPGAALPLQALDYEPGVFAAYLPVRATLKDGAEVSGYRVNEDSFTIQIRDLAGTLTSLRKARLARLEKSPGESVMPSFRDALSPREIDDVVAYLAGLRGQP